MARVVFGRLPPSPQRGFATFIWRAHTEMTTAQVRCLPVSKSTPSLRLAVSKRGYTERTRDSDRQHSPQKNLAAATNLLELMQVEACSWSQPTEANLANPGGGGVHLPAHKKGALGRPPFAVNARARAPAVLVSRVDHLGEKYGRASSIPTRSPALPFSHGPERGFLPVARCQRCCLSRMWLD